MDPNRGGVILTLMSKSWARLRGHLAVIASQCDMLEDIFSSRNEIMTRVNVIRNAAHHITNAIELQSRSPSERMSRAHSDSEAAGES